MLETIKNFISTNAEWIFDGIGTELLSLVIGGVLGYIAGFKRGKQKSGSQNQSGGSDSNQRQELHIEADLEGESIITQKQKGGKNSTQVQIGEIKRGTK